MTYQQEYMVNSATETKEFGKVIGRHAVDGLVIAFQGDLGAGKTHLAQGIAEGMGINGTVASPTFTLLNEYEGHNHLALYHFDLYRLEQTEELDGIAFYEYGTEGVTLIEWADRFFDEISPDAIWIQLEKTGEETVRKIVVKVPLKRLNWWKEVEADVVGSGYIRTNLYGGSD